VLDVGCGSGYLVAAFYQLVKDPNHFNRVAVVGIEHIEQLVELSVNNLKKGYSKELETNQISIICGDGRQGYSEEAPYDIIHVGAASTSVPQELI